MYDSHRLGPLAPNFGKKFSDVHRSRISKTRITMGLASGTNNPMYGKKQKQSTRELISNKAVERLVNGSHHKFYKKGYFYSNKLQKSIWYDSSYELAALNIFENDKNIVNFGRNKISIKYQHNGSIRNTLPDFFIETVDKNKTIIEV